MKPVTFLMSMLIIVLIFIATSVSIADSEYIDAPVDGGAEAMMDYGLYCSMVEQWEKERMMGVDLHDRTGWAPVIGRCK